MSNVLVVDDVRLNRDIVRALLGGHGHQIQEAAGAAEALVTVRSAHPDVVVTDVLMPGMDGYELLREIRADPATSDTPVVFYTANYLESEAQPLADAGGVTQVVLRTDDPGVLITAVEAALSGTVLSAARPDLVQFDREHLHAVNNKLITKVRDLHATEEQFRIIADESPIGIVLTDNAAMARYVSPRVADILRLPAPALAGFGWLTAYDVATRGVLTAAVDGDQPGVRHRTHLTTLDGEPLWLDLIVRRVVDVHGENSGAVVMIDDVTELVTTVERAREETARHESEMRQRLTERLDGFARMSGTVAHEFNNILAGSQAYLTFAIESLTAALDQGQLDAGNGPDILQDLERSRRSGQRAADVSRKLLAFGRHEIIHPTEVDLHELITDLAAEIRARPGARIDLRLDLTPSRIRVQVDPTQLSQALRHLVDNAEEAMPTGGTCTITCAGSLGEDPGHAVITVRDSGIGMSAATAAQSIDPFYTTKPRSQGTGLGLTTAYGIITQAGGQLSIESAPGEGALVRILLPVGTISAKKPAAPVGATPTRRDAVTILVVDDEDDVRAIVERILTKAGYLVVTAHDGADALATAQQHSGLIDCLITDVMMPVMNGRELVQHFEEAYPETPVLFMSGYAAALIDEQGMLDPGSTVITKPFTKADLLEAVGKKLGAALSRPA